MRGGAQERSPIITPPAEEGGVCRWGRCVGRRSSDGVVWNTSPLASMEQSGAPHKVMADVGVIETDLSMWATI